MQINLHYGATLVWLVLDSPSRHTQSRRRGQYGCCLRPVYDQVEGILVEGLEKIRFEMSYNKKNYHSAGFGRKVILVIFVIFELGPDSESLCNALPSESIS